MRSERRDVHDRSGRRRLVRVDDRGTEDLARQHRPVEVEPDDLVERGNAIVYLGGAATGTISGNTVSKYQKNGITVSGDPKAKRVTRGEGGESPPPPVYTHS
jgi:hypothetical protein